jgi:hypothetical protein
MYKERTKRGSVEQIKTKMAVFWAVAPCSLVEVEVNFFFVLIAVRTSYSTTLIYGVGTSLHILRTKFAQNKFRDEGPSSS